VARSGLGRCWAALVSWARRQIWSWELWWGLRWKYTRGNSCFLPRKQMKSFPVVVRNDSAGLTVCTPTMRNQNWSTGLELEVVETWQVSSLRSKKFQVFQIVFVSFPIRRGRSSWGPNSLGISQKLEQKPDTLWTAGLGWAGAVYSWGNH
jgi:hypothetical protein